MNTLNTKYLRISLAVAVVLVHSFLIDFKCVGKIVQIPEVELDSIVYKLIKEKAFPLKYFDMYNFCVVGMAKGDGPVPDIEVCFFDDTRHLYWDFGDGFVGYTVIDDIIVFIARNPISKKWTSLKEEGPALLYIEPRRPKFYTDLIYIKEYQAIPILFEDGEHKVFKISSEYYRKIRDKFHYIDRFPKVP